MPESADLTGQRFGRLVVLAYLSECLWHCRCDCGHTTRASGSNLRRGKHRSCGCLSNELTIQRSRTHGGSNTPEYRTWKRLRGRCTNPNSPDFPYYGGRGIRVCDRWLNSYADFLADVGPRPSAKHSLDRFPNNDGNYEPHNVRWTTHREQMNNTRAIGLKDLDGNKIGFKRAAEILATTASVLRWHFKRVGLPVTFGRRNYKSTKPPCWCGKKHYAKGLCINHYGQLTHRRRRTASGFLPRAFRHRKPSTNGCDVLLDSSHIHPQ